MIDSIYVIWHKEDVRRRIEEGLKDFIDVPITYIRGPSGNDHHFSQWLLENDYTPMGDWKQGDEDNPRKWHTDWHKRDHKYGEIACGIAHLSAWKQAKEDGVECPLFLEQDAVPNSCYTWSQTGELINFYLKKLKQYNMEWDIFYAGQADACISENIIGELQKTKWTYCLHAYILTPKALNEVLSHDFEHNLCVADEYIPAFYALKSQIHPKLRHLRGKLTAYNVEIMPFIQEQGELPSGKRDSDTDNSEYVSDSFFIEIGTSDFDTLEPLAQLGWKGIFVEPIGELLNNIERFDGCFYEESAILDYSGKTDIQYYDLDWAKEWQRGVGNTSDVNNFNCNPHFKEHVRAARVNVLTLDMLIDKYNVKRIDYLKIDIEGLEYKILENYSWRILPKKIKCEHIHWNDRPMLRDPYKMLKKLGYKITMLPEDFIAEL